MPDMPEPNPSAEEVQTRLQEVARLLRKSGSLDVESQRYLAELVDELSVVLQTTHAPPAEVAHLVDSTAHLAEALHHQQDKGILERARERMEETLIKGETHAPVAVGLARRLLDALANIGI